jgi:uncharacterized protein YycO
MPIEAPPSVSVYILDQNLISPGDVLLTSSPSGWESKAIRAATGAPFSHAALCVRYGQFIEAIGPGVCRLAIMATGARAKENIRLLRLSDRAVANAADKAKAAAQVGEQYLSRGYSVPGALGVKVAMLRDPERAGMFCSQLVARAYDEVGIQLVPGKTPEAIAPGDLLRSPLLRDVTAEALILLRTDEHPPYYLDDASLVERPHHYEVITKLEILSSEPVQRALDQLKETPRSFWELERVLARRKDPGLDSAILSELQKHRFAETYVQKLFGTARLEEMEKSTREALAKIERGTMSDAELRNIIWQSASIHKLLQEDVDDRREQFQGHERRYEEDGLATFGYFAALQKQLLARSVDCLNAKTRELNALIPETQRRGMKPGPPV